jgi:hypothetical protein
MLYIRRKAKMNPKEQRSIGNDKIRTVIMTAITGGAFGLLYGYGFEISLWLGVLIGALFGAAVGFRISKRPPRMEYPMAIFHRIMMAATFLLLTSFGYSYLLDQNLNQTQQYWAAALPLLGWSILVVSIGLAIASLDEMQRRIQTEAIAIGFAGTAIFVGGYALFQFAGLPEVNVGLVLLAMSGFWLAGKLWTLWRYR